MESACLREGRACCRLPVRGLDLRVRISLTSLYLPACLIRHISFLSLSPSLPVSLSMPPFSTLSPPLSISGACAESGVNDLSWFSAGTSGTGAEQAATDDLGMIDFLNR